MKILYFFPFFYMGLKFGGLMDIKKWEKDQVERLHTQFKSGAVYGEKQGTETTDGGRNYNSAMCDQSDIYNVRPGPRPERGLGTSSQHLPPYKKQNVS